MSQGAGGGGLRGALLAGGPGSRMGGGKPWRELAGRRLIDLALEALALACPRVMVLAADAADMAELPCDVLADRWPGQGPLAALATAFLDSDADGLLVLAVDLPLARPALLARLAAGHGHCQALAPIGPQGWPEPLMAYYSRACLPAALRLLERGERRTRMLFKAVNAEFLPAEETRALDPRMLSFLNLNFPQDLAAAEAAARASGLFATAAGESVAPGTHPPRRAVD
ncbi:MAG: molybdenum cofactor guanylyltransferase [Thermodesulfobacteriota bacterium]